MFTATSVLGFILLSRRNKSIKSFCFLSDCFICYILLNFSLAKRLGYWRLHNADVFLDQDSFIYTTFPWLKTIIILLYGYWGDGLNFIGNFLVMLCWMTTGLTWLLPRLICSLMLRLENTEAFVSMGIRWVPGMIGFS